MSGFNKERIESRLIEAISLLIVNKEIKSPDLSSLCSVSRAELSSDNAYATIYISSVLDDQSLKKSVDALNRASGFIQKKVGGFLKTRNTPVLTFKADNSVKEAHTVNTLLNSLQEDGQ